MIAPIKTLNFVSKNKSNICTIMQAHTTDTRDSLCRVEFIGVDEVGDAALCLADLNSIIHHSH